MFHEMDSEGLRRIEELPDCALIKLKTVLSLFDGLGKSKWYEGIKAGKYPRPVKIDRSSRWVVGEIRALLNTFKNQPR
ncbi:MAG: hypothetical protein KDC07_10335 [Chitinophagaceae bacterium]|nr:hypothetical protein [Chitinophagaceae bacterium]